MKSRSSDFLLDIRYPMYVQNKLAFDRSSSDSTPSNMLHGDGVWSSPFNTANSRFQPMKSVTPSLPEKSF